MRIEDRLYHLLKPLIVSSVLSGIAIGIGVWIGYCIWGDAVI